MINTGINNNTIEANGEEGLICRTHLSSGTINNNTLYKNNTSKKPTCYSVDLECDMTNVDVAFNSIHDTLTPKCIDYNLHLGAGKKLKDCVVKYNLLQGYKTGAILDESNKEGYTETDLLELKRYHALCLIRNEDNVYSAFVVKLPK